MHTHLESRDKPESKSRVLMWVFQSGRGAARLARLFGIQEVKVVFPSLQQDVFNVPKITTLVVSCSLKLVSI
jgi:hypothetical protein